MHQWVFYYTASILAPECFCSDGILITSPIIIFVYCTFVMSKAIESRSSYEIELDEVNADINSLEKQIDCLKSRKRALKKLISDDVRQSTIQKHSSNRSIISNVKREKSSSSSSSTSSSPEKKTKIDEGMAEEGNVTREEDSVDVDKIVNGEDLVKVDTTVTGEVVVKVESNNIGEAVAEVGVAATSNDTVNACIINRPVAKRRPGAGRPRGPPRVASDPCQSCENWALYGNPRGRTHTYNENCLARRPRGPV